MTTIDTSNLKIFTGNANPALAEAIAKYIGVELGSVKVGHFKNSETQVMIGESIRGKDVFIVQSTCQPVNDNLMELLIMTDACKRASAKTITLVVPYYAYARQDRKTRGREPISAKLVADLMTTAGATRVMTMDLHAGQIQGFFNIPVDHMVGEPVLAKYFQKMDKKELVVVSPDLGGVTRARLLADRLDTPIAIIEKRRPMPGVAEVMNLIGNVEGKTAIIIDDMVDTAGSLVEGAKALANLGAKEVYACCSHAILSDPAVERIKNSNIKELIVTDSIPLSDAKKCDKIKVQTIAPLLAQAMLKVYTKTSISEIFE